MRRIGGYLAVFLTVVVLGVTTVNATENAEIKEKILLELTQEAVITEKPDETSTVVGTLPAGTAVISAEASKDDWIKISYKDITGYTLVQNVKVYGSEGLEQEFEQLGTQNKLMMNELEYIETQKKQEITWGVTIAALVIAIFAVSIASAITKNIHDMDRKREAKKQGS